MGDRRCPACDEPVRTRTARWCGSCGAELAPATDATADATGPASARRRLLLGGVAAAAVALVAVGVLAGGGLVDHAATSSTAVPDDEVAAPDDDVLDDLGPTDEPAVAPVDEPTCADGPPQGCFLWAAEVGHSTSTYGSAVRGDQHLVGLAPEDGTIWARDLRDGEVVWSSPGADTSSEEHLALAGDLVLHRADDALVARDVATGEERWRNADLGRVRLHATGQDGDGNLMLAGDQTDLSTDAAITYGTTIVAVDATSGDLRWHREGEVVAVTADGTGLVSSDGVLAAYGPEGELRWESETAAADVSWMWSGVHVAVVDVEEGLPRLHSLVDGEPLPFSGMPLASDADHTLIAVIEPADGRGSTPAGQLVLLDRDGEVWRTTLEGSAGCPAGAALEPSTIQFTACGGERFVLDRSDGAVRALTEPGATSRPMEMFRRPLGPYELVPSWDGDEASGLLLVDPDSGEEVARLGAESWPVAGGNHDDGWNAGTAGVVVVQSAGWLVALDLRDDA